MIGAIFTLVVALAFAAGPFLFPEFGGFAPDRFPIPQEDPPIQPAGYAFAIWGVIYLWLVVSAIFGLWRRADDPDWARMRPALILSMALGVVWLPVANENPLLAMVMIWAMWATALSALFRAPQSDRSMALWPVGLYTGWLSAASAVATGFVLGGYGLLGEEAAALLMVGFAVALSASIQLKLRRAPTFAIAVAWALVAIFVVNQSDFPQVAGLAGGGAIGMAALAIFAAVGDLRGRLRES